jgi:hypothetical protein
MDQLVPMFRQIVVAGAVASLDIAGVALFPPPAWPILKAALEPVLERLKERLGGQVLAAGFCDHRSATLRDEGSAS